MLVLRASSAISYSDMSQVAESTGAFLFSRSSWMAFSTSLEDPGKMSTKEKSCQKHQDMSAV
jgi:hypothetical protein